MYVFMDTEYNQYEVEGNMGDTLNYLVDGMEDVRSDFLQRQAISVELPTTIVREVSTPNRQYAAILPARS